MPWWAWVLVVWCVLSALASWGLSRWFRYLRDIDPMNDLEERFGQH